MKLSFFVLIIIPNYTIKHLQEKGPIHAKDTCRLYEIYAILINARENGMIMRKYKRIIERIVNVV